MNLYISVLRTAVPLLVGWVITAAGTFGLDADSTTVTAGVTALVTAVYYAVFRALEEWAAKQQWTPLRIVAGVLLGWARPPEYPARSAEAAAAPEPVPARAVGPDVAVGTAEQGAT